MAIKIVNNHTIVLAVLPLVYFTQLHGNRSNHEKLTSINICSPITSHSIIIIYVNFCQVGLVFIYP